MERFINKVMVDINDVVVKYVHYKMRNSKQNELYVLKELLEEGYDVKLGYLYRRYVSGEITLRNMNRELGLEYRELYQVLEEKHLPF